MFKTDSQLKKNNLVQPKIENKWQILLKEQKNVRKQSYDPNSRESRSNEFWTGKEGLDGITSLPVDKKKD